MREIQILLCLLHLWVKYCLAELGCLSFQVRKYKRPPLRCYKCQRHWHHAAACRGNRGCAKCGGKLDMLECNVEDSKCCNCGGTHMASFWRCPHFKRAKHVQEVRDQYKVSYAEAVKRVGGYREVRSVAGVIQGGSLVSSPPLTPVMSPDTIVVKKESLLAFMADVVYATKKTGSRSDIIKAVAEAAGRFLGMKNYEPQTLHEYMKGGQMSQGSQQQEENEEQAEPESMEGRIFREHDEND